MSKEDSNIDDLSEDEIGVIMNVISSDGYYINIKIKLQMQLSLGNDKQIGS